jgi:small GTP-binding protein
MSNHSNSQGKPPTGKMPAFTQEAARIVWSRLGPAERQAVEEIIQAFPSQTGMLRLLLKLASSQVKVAFGRKHRVAIVGPTNVGKSTIYNQLVQHKEDRAEVSPLPGTTRINQQADAGPFAVIDTPGADAVGEVGQSEQDQAMTAAAGADFLIIVFDAIQGIKRTELELYDMLTGLGKPYVVVMNKIDMVRKERDKVIQTAAAALKLQPEQIIPVVARTGEGLNDVLVAITMTEPEVVAALGAAMPKYRWQLAWRSIVSAASASAVIALTPLPVIDFVPLVATQSVMVLGIARIYNYKITLQRARELVMAFGLGFLGRTVFQQISKLGGVPGWLLSAAVATSTTVVMGYAASVWFETGERVSNDALRRMTADMTRALLQIIRGSGKARPDKKSLKSRIEEALHAMPMARDRAPLDRQTVPPPAPGDPSEPSEPPPSGERS